MKMVETRTRIAARTSSEQTYFVEMAVETDVERQNEANGKTLVVQGVRW